MRIAAIADIHSPIYLELFWKSLQKIKKPDMFLLAGDICNRGLKNQYKPILELIERKTDCLIIACFGNDEFEQHYDYIKELVPKIKFLVDESLIIEIKGREIGIVGSKGGLDRPTYWQQRNIKDIYEKYEKRYKRVKELLERLKTKVKILLMHYSPTYKTLKGENPEVYSSLSYKRYEDVITELKPSLVMHGHAHNGIPLAFINKIPIFNVSLPANNKIIEIDLDNLPKTGLEKFV